MNTKNVVIAGIVALSVVLGGCSTLAEARKGSNEVAKVPTLSADVPFKVELPFLYSQKPFSLDEVYVTKSTLTKDVQKKGVQESPKVTSAKEIFEQLPKQKVVVQEVSVVEDDGFKYYDNIPLDKELQRKISKFAEKKGIEVTLEYALMAQESHFDPKLISPTHDHGISQINRGNFKWITKDLEDEYGIDFTWSNPYENAVASIHYLALIKESWEGKVSNKNLIPTILLSYNMGTGNANKYLKSHSANDWKYVQKVLNYKSMIERGEKVE
jgi:hypothetical protein